MIHFHKYVRKVIPVSTTRGIGIFKRDQDEYAIVFKCIKCGKIKGYFEDMSGNKYKLAESYAIDLWSGNG